MSDYHENPPEIWMRVGIAYTLTHKTLQRLPIPIELPVGIGGEISATEVKDALIRAYDLVQEIPVDDMVEQLIIQQILDMIAALTFAVGYSMSPTEWLFDIVDYATARVVTLAEALENAPGLE